MSLAKVELWRAIKVDVNGGDARRLRLVIQKRWRFLKEMREGARRWMLVANTLQSGIESKAKSVEITAIVHEKNGRIVIGLGILIKLTTTQIGPVVIAHSPKAFALCPKRVLAKIALLEWNRDSCIFEDKFIASDQSFIGLWLTTAACLTRVHEISGNSVKRALVYKKAALLSSRGHVVRQVLGQSRRNASDIARILVVDEHHGSIAIFVNVAFTAMARAAITIETPVLLNCIDFGARH